MHYQFTYFIVVYHLEIDFVSLCRFGDGIFGRRCVSLCHFIFHTSQNQKQTSKKEKRFCCFGSFDDSLCGLGALLVDSTGKNTSIKLFEKSILLSFVSSLSSCHIHHQVYFIWRPVYVCSMHADLPNVSSISITFTVYQRRTLEWTVFFLWNTIVFVDL